MWRPELASLELLYKSMQAHLDFTSDQVTGIFLSETSRLIHFLKNTNTMLFLLRGSFLKFKGLNSDAQRNLWNLQASEGKHALGC